MDPGVIGYDEVIHVDSNHASDVAPITAKAMSEAREPWFMSVGFFETHRDFAAPTSVRDSLYSLPPANLPDAKATRQDIAAFKASARSLDQGIGAVLHQIHDLDLQERTLVICTTDHGLAFPGAKATLYDRGIGVMMVMRGPGGFTGGRGDRQARLSPGPFPDAPGARRDGPRERRDLQRGHLPRRV
jgi:membrane-anchored protein YejM (alkaline phosphatase superfamily)